MSCPEFHKPLMTSDRATVYSRFHFPPLSLADLRKEENPYGKKNFGYFFRKGNAWLIHLCLMLLKIKGNMEFSGD
jgi:hypothetical protein